MNIPEQYNQPKQDDCLFCQEHLEEAAMRTLEPEIQQQMESHLARCWLCRAELAEIEQTLQVLALGVHQVDPPETSRSALMSRLEAERSRPTEPVKPLASTTSVTRQPSRSTFPRFPWSPGSIAAGFLVALLAITAWNFLPLRDADNDIPRGQIEVMAMENTCPDCPYETGGQLGADPKEKDGLVVAWNLDPHRKHEVWCVNREGRHTKVGDLHVGESGSVLQKVSFPDEVGGYQQIYVVRDDGAEELSVTPGSGRQNPNDSVPDTTPPGG